MAFCSEIKNSSAANAFASPEQDSLAPGEELTVSAAAQGAFEQLLSEPAASPTLQGRVSAAADPDRPKMSLKNVLGLDFSADIAMKVLFKRWQLEGLSLLSLLGVDLYDKLERLSHPSPVIQNLLNLHREMYSAFSMFLCHACYKCTDDMSGNIPQLIDINLFSTSIEQLKEVKKRLLSLPKIDKKEISAIVRATEVLICVIEYEKKFYSETGQFCLLDKKISDFEEGSNAVLPCIENRQKAYQQLRIYMNYCAFIGKHSSIKMAGFAALEPIANEFIPELESFTEESMASLRGSIHLFRLSLILTENQVGKDLGSAQEATLNYEDWCVKHQQPSIQKKSREELIDFLFEKRWNARLVADLLLPAVSTVDSRIVFPFISQSLHMDRFIEKISDYQDVFSEAEESILTNTPIENPLIKKLAVHLRPVMDLIQEHYGPLLLLASQPNLKAWLNQLNIRKNYRDLPFWIHNLIESGSFEGNLYQAETAYAVLISESIKFISQLLNNEILEEEIFRLFSEAQIEETFSVVQDMYSVLNRCLVATMSLSQDMREIVLGDLKEHDLEAVIQSVNQLSDSICNIIRFLHRRAKVETLAANESEAIEAPLPFLPPLNLEPESASLAAPLTAEELSSDEKDSEEIEEASPEMTPPQHALDRQIKTVAERSRIKKATKPRREKAPLDSRHLKKELRKRGYKLKRQGPHQIFINPEGQIIPVPRRGEQKRGTAEKILQMTRQWMS